MASCTIPTKVPVERYVYLVAGLILGPPTIVLILAITLIAIPLWSMVWAVRDNGPMDKSPKDWWDTIWDLISRRMIRAWWTFILGREPLADETPDPPKSDLPARVKDRLRTGGQAPATDRSQG